MTTQPKLKACPKCHNSQSVALLDYNDDVHDYFYVKCGECGIALDGNFQTKETAIEAWNTRPTPPTADDGTCQLCGKKTNSLVGNPSEWDTLLPILNGDGKLYHHHIGCCVVSRLYKTPSVDRDEVVELMVNAIKGKQVHVDSLRAQLMLSALESKYKLIPKEKI